MKEKYNFRTELLTKTVSLDVALAVFPVGVILRAVYHFIDQANVIVKEGQEKISVTLILKKESVTEKDLEDLAFEFNVQLVASFVEDEDNRRHAGVRDALVRAALSPAPQGGTRPQPSNPPQPNRT